MLARRRHAPLPFRQGLTLSGLVTLAALGLTASARAMIAAQPGPPLLVGLGVTTDGGYYQYSYTIDVGSTPAGIYSSFGYFNINGLVPGSATVSGDVFTGGADTDHSLFFTTDGSPGEGLKAGSPVRVTFDSTLAPTGTTELFAGGGDSSGDRIATQLTTTGPGAATGPGASQATALGPTTTVDNADGTVTYTFTDVKSGTWVDPPTSGYIFTIDPGGPLFSDIILPTNANSPTDLFTVQYGSTTVQEAGGSALDFGGAGTSAFTVTGIDAPGVSAFPLQVFFERGGVGSFTQQSLADSPAPEPSSVAAFALTGLGTAGLILKARKRKSIA